MEKFIIITRTNEIAYNLCQCGEKLARQVISQQINTSYKTSRKYGRE